MISPLILGVCLFLLGFLPLLGGLRYEAALVTGIVLPGWVAVVVASRTFRRLVEEVRSAGAGLSAGELRVIQFLGLGLRDGIAHMGSVLVVALVHGLVQGFCEPELGFSLLVLGPFMGAALGAVCGAAMMLLLARYKSSRFLDSGLGWRWSLLALIAPLLSALWALYRFYSTPTVYAYDQFAGYFSGPLYDTVEYDLARLLSFRAGTLLLLGGILSTCSALRMVCLDGRFAFKWAGGLQFYKDPVLLLGLCSLGGYAAISSYGAELGHRGTADSIRRALGQRLVSAQCRVLYSDRIERVVARRIAQECEGHLRQHQAYFGLERIEPVTVYLFADSAEKRYLMGAGRTNIAKPWRREVYITNDGFPHSILGHELAHVVTGAFGQGPFRVAGSLGGLVVDPGRVEGFAEAAALRENSFGTLKEWAAAMKRVDQLPGLGRLFQLGFLGESAARSYTAAGAFVEFVRSEFGPGALRSWYGGASLFEATGKSWGELETAWHQQLDEVLVPNSVIETAKPKFSRPGIFARKCPHASDRKHAAFIWQCQQNEVQARELLKQLLLWDPDEQGLMLEAPRCVGALGSYERAYGETLEILAKNDAFEPHEKRRAQDFLGDMAWRMGKTAQAKEHFMKARALSFDPDQLRQLDVKIWATLQGEVLQTALKRVFLASDAEGWSTQAVLYSLREQGEYTSLASYLLTRLSMAGQRYDEARHLASAVQVEELPLLALRKEFLRMRVLLSCEHSLLSGGSSDLEQLWTQYLEMNLNNAELVHATKFVERCRVD